MESSVITETLVNHVGQDTNALARFFVNAFPSINNQEQYLARTLYQLLAKGEPVTMVHLVDTLDQPLKFVQQALEKWPGVFYNDHGDIVGFWGISVNVGRHHIEANGINAYTWCAWDSLFIPELLGTTVRVTSACAHTERPIKLVVSPDNIQSIEPAETVVSFLMPDVEKFKGNVTASFCHHVYFFSTREAGETWVSGCEGTFLLTPGEALEVGRKMNAVRYSAVLK